MTTFHSDPICGAVCAHDERTVWRLFWLGPGSDAIYIGGCMSEPPMISRADVLSGAETVGQFKAVAKGFFAS